MATQATLTATANPDTASVDLEFEDPLGELWGAAEILRFDANGVHPVRAGAGFFPANGQGHFTVTDYEPALTGLIEYRAVGVIPGTGTSAWVRLSGTEPRISVPAVPAYNLAVESVLTYDAKLTTRTTVHQIIGRRDPIVVQGALSMRSGRMGIGIADHPTAVLLLALLGKGRTCLFRQAEHRGQDMYFHPQDVTLGTDVIDGARTSWRLDLAYTEVAAPTGDRAPDTFTYADLAAEHRSYNDVAAGFENYLDVAVNEPKVGA